MRADNTAALAAAARQRHELTRAKAIRAIQQAKHDGTPVTFESIARSAGISRSWLYEHPGIRREIEQLRDATRLRAPAPPLPANQRASDASLRTRLAAALQRNRQLAEENARLRRQLARALGDHRSAWPDTTRQPS
jgi:Family of unknown function (DUF6262)